MEKFDAIVCGAGPAGVSAALKIASNGKKTLCVEAGEIGGTCLNRGCIPTKAFIASADAYLSAREAGKFGVEFEGVNFDWRQVCQHSQQTVEKLRKGLDFLFRKNGIRLYQSRFQEKSGRRTDGGIHCRKSEKYDGKQGRRRRSNASGCGGNCGSHGKQLLSRTRGACGKSRCGN